MMIEYIVHKDGVVVMFLIVDNLFLELEMSDQDINFIDGYAVIEFEIEGLCYVSGIINSNYKIVTPFNVSKDDLKSITLFKNKKAIYETTDEKGNQTFLLIDLEKTLKQTGENTKPKLNVMTKFDGYDDLSDEKAIVIIDNKYAILDVSNVKLSNIKFDKILEVDEKDGEIKTFGVVNVGFTYSNSNEDVYYMDGEYASSYDLYFKILPDGTVTNPIYVNDIELWIPEEKLDDLDYIASMVNDTFINPKKERAICKVLQ